MRHLLEHGQFLVRELVMRTGRSRGVVRRHLERLEDCRGIRELSPTFAEELFVTMANEHHVWLEPINATEKVHVRVSALVSQSPEHVVNTGRMFSLGQRRAEQ